MARGTIGPDPRIACRIPTRAGYTSGRRPTRSLPPSTGCARPTSRWVLTRRKYPVIIDEKDIYRQFGPEAMAVLDRVFYLGGLPRPNVGIARKQLDEINEILMSHKNPLVHHDAYVPGNPTSITSR